MAYSVYELSRLSLAVYERMASNIAPWRPKIDFPRRNGFYGTLFQHDRHSNSYVLAFRGTDDGYDLVPNLLAFAGEVPNQYASAEDSLRIARGVMRHGANLALTGHSLGGGLAQLLAAKRGVPAVVFNAPGMSRSYVTSIGVGAIPVFGPFFGLAVGAALDHDWILNIRATGDAVSIGTGPRLGRIRSVRLPGCGLTVDSLSPGRTARTAFVPELGTASSVEAEALAHLTAGALRAVLCQHSMLQMEQQLKNMPEFRQPLDWFRPNWRLGSPFADAASISAAHQRAHA